MVFGRVVEFAFYIVFFETLYSLRRQRMRYQDLLTKRVLQIRKVCGISAGMAPKWMIPLILGAMLAMPQVTHAYSFGGSDWLLDMAGTFYVRSTLGNSDNPFNEVDIPSTINQVQ